jgi:putative transposase
MRYDPEKHARRSIRLKGWDYSQPSWYYVTICTHHRACLLGVVVQDEMRLSEIGEITREEWLRTPLIRPEVVLDEWVIMPNHLHGIIILRDDRNGDHTVGANGDSPQRARSQTTSTMPFRSPSRTIGAIVRGFKSAVTKRANVFGNRPGTPLWQRNYYEHIVRDEDDLFRIRMYIRSNPLKWALDEKNPESA